LRTVPTVPLLLAGALLLAGVLAAAERGARCRLFELEVRRAVAVVFVFPPDEAFGRDPRDEAFARDPFAELFAERVFGWLREFALLAIWSLSSRETPCPLPAYPVSGAVTDLQRVQARTGAFELCASCCAHSSTRATTLSRCCSSA
jgi:hypothetical protein